MLKNTLIIALIILLIYLYYQKQSKPSFLGGDSEQRIKDLTTELQQAHQLETYNSEQLRNYETQVNRLKEQLETYSSGDNWETKTASVIASLEQEVSDLTTERDEALREMKTTEQENLSLGNKLKLKSQEADNKAQEIERLKKEKSQSEIALNKRIEELRKDQKDLKQKYSEREKLLDEEQTDNNKLTKENEKLTVEITELKRSKSPAMPGNWDYEEELTKENKELSEQVKNLTVTLTAERERLTGTIHQREQEIIDYQNQVSGKLKEKDQEIKDLKNQLAEVAERESGPRRSLRERRGRK